MRLTFAAVAAILSLGFLASAIPASALLIKLPMVMCNQTHSGKLVLSTPLEHPAHNLPVRVPAYSADDQGGLIAASVSRKRSSADVVFETCTTPGWNVAGDTYGRIRLFDFNYCLSVINTFARVSQLTFEDCSRYQDGALQGQWFIGYKNTRGGFFMVPTGNPNKNISIIRSHLYFNYATDDPNPNIVSAGRSFTRQVVQFQIIDLV